MTIYFVPGLASDKRIFKNLAQELSEYNLVFLEHIGHLNHEETLQQYAIRMIRHQEFFDVDSIIIGLSLGGMIAVEISKIINFKKVILISTVKHRSELPFLIRIASRFKIYLPPVFIKNGVGPLSLLLNVTDKEGSNYLSEIISEFDENHIIWAQKAVTKWNNNLIPNNYLHIQGTKDEIFPVNCVKATHKIQGGTHYMIMDRAKEIANIIKENIR